MEVFRCQQCGICCRGEGGIFLRPEAVPAAAEVLGLTSAEFLERYTELRHGLISIRVDAEGWCLLHVGTDHTCRIHRAKPVMCRDWPFFYGPLASREGFEAARNNCPGINPECTWEEFQEYHRTHVGQWPPVSYITAFQKENRKDHEPDFH